MTPRDILLALGVALVWGTNFVAIKLSYEAFTPFALLCVRFVIATFPFVFFIPRPKTPFKDVFYVALFLWMGQFSFLFVGIYLGAPPGIASLLMQTQSIFTVLLSVLFFHYKPKWIEMVGLGVAFLGILWIAYEKLLPDSWVGIALLFPAALSVSISNVLIGKSKKTDEHPLSLVVWSSLIPILPMYGMCYLFEGPDALSSAFKKLTIVSGSAILYTGYLSTLLAASWWTLLLRKHPPSHVVPFSLLIPVFGMASATLVFDERISVTSLMASGCIIIGLCVNQLARRWVPKLDIRKVT